MAKKIEAPTFPKRGTKRQKIDKGEKDSENKKKKKVKILSRLLNGDLILVNTCIHMHCTQDLPVTTFYRSSTKIH